MPKRGQVIVNDYLQKIVAGELSVGELLPTESTMIQQYGVSRTAVREAVQTLAHKGFVRIRQGSGSTVAPRSSWNVLDSEYLALTGQSQSLADDLAEAREIVGPAAASLAAANGNPDQIDRLRAIVSAMGQTKDSKKLAALDADLHQAIAESTGNLVLESLIHSLNTLEVTSAQPNSEALAQTEAWSDHVVDAIASRDPEAARDAMRMHMRKLHR